MTADSVDVAGQARDPSLLMTEQVLSTVDLLRRRLEGGAAPMAVVYLEGARGCLHHARESMLHYMRRAGEDWSMRLPGGATIVGETGRRLCRVETPPDWQDEVLPTSPDLGSDLFASQEMREGARGRLFCAMLAAALADHTWLHLPTGSSWATDRSGAVALVGALAGGRPIDFLTVDQLSGSLDETIVRQIAGLGWRRLRSPRLEPS